MAGLLHTTWHMILTFDLDPRDFVDLSCAIPCSVCFVALCDISGSASFAGFSPGGDNDTDICVILFDNPTLRHILVCISGCPNDFFCCTYQERSDNDPTRSNPRGLLPIPWSAWRVPSGPRSFISGEFSFPMGQNRWHTCMCQYLFPTFFGGSLDGIYRRILYTLCIG